MNLVKKLLPLFIIIGVFGFILVNTLGGGESAVTFLYSNNINGITFYKFNWLNYIDQVKQSVGQIAQLELHKPTREWLDFQATVLEKEFWEGIANNLALMLDWIIFGLNVIIYPFRIGAYAVKQIISILGINLNGEHFLKWLIDLIKFLQGLEIPYV